MSHHRIIESFVCVCLSTTISSTTISLYEYSCTSCGLGLLNQVGIIPGMWEGVNGKPVLLHSYCIKVRLKAGRTGETCMPHLTTFYGLIADERPFNQYFNIFILVTYLKDKSKANAQETVMVGDDFSTKSSYLIQ